MTVASGTPICARMNRVCEWPSWSSSKSRRKERDEANDMRDSKPSGAQDKCHAAALLRFLLVLCWVALLALVGCTAHADPAAEAPLPANIVPASDPSLFAVDHPEQFPLTAAVAHSAAIGVGGDRHIYPRRRSQRSSRLPCFRQSCGDSCASWRHRQERPSSTDHSKRRCGRRFRCISQGDLG